MNLQRPHRHYETILFYSTTPSCNAQCHVLVVNALAKLETRFESSLQYNSLYDYSAVSNFTMSPLLVRMTLESGSHPTKDRHPFDGLALNLASWLLRLNARVCPCSSTPTPASYCKVGDSGHEETQIPPSHKNHAIPIVLMKRLICQSVFCEHSFRQMSDNE